MSLFISPHIRRLIDLALDEDDLGFDVSSQIFFGDRGDQRGRFLAKQDMIFCGQGAAQAVFARVDPAVQCSFEVADGARVSRGTTLGWVEGPTLALLRGERTALNFLQRMSGVATLTGRFVEAAGEGGPRIADTRKTLPGWRELDKYAVRSGGGANHRFSLGGGLMIKDNHIMAAGGVAAAVERARSDAPHTLRVEVEVSDLAQTRAALEAGADIIMLDNMDNEQMSEAIALIREHSGARVVIEASGNMDLDRLPGLQGLDLDVVSVGALTHSAVAADISMKLVEEGDDG